MKAQLLRQYISNFCYTFLTAATISCNNQNQSNQLKDNKSDFLKLKYTTGIRSILEDSKGNIWFGSHQEGVCLLQNGKLHYFTTKNGLSDNQVRNIYEDKNGIIWFECGRGLSTYNGKEITIYKERNYNSKNEWKLNDNDLWFKGDQIEGYNRFEKFPGIYQYDGQKLYYRLFPVTPKSEDGFKYYISTPFIKSKNGAVWFGAYGAVIEYNGSTFKILDNESLGLNSKTGFLHVRNIMEDNKGNIWIANNGIGVLMYDGKKAINFTEQQKLKKNDTKENSLEKVFSIGEDNSGNIWFGTLGSGIWKYDFKSVKNFTKEEGIESNHIWTIYKSKKGEMWFGVANPSGIYSFNGKSFERKY